MANERDFGSLREWRGGPAGREWGTGAAGGYGRSGDYGHDGGTGRWGGANAGVSPEQPNRERESLVAQHWMRGGRGANAGANAGTNVGTLLAGIGIGAAFMYFFDPARGARRRNIFADKARSYFRDIGNVARNKAMDTRNRAGGRFAEMRGRFRDEEIGDDQLIARVRAELGHHVERVRPIEVAVENGAVTLRGFVTEDELPAVISVVERVRGVDRVVNELQVRPPGQETRTSQF